MKIEKNGVKLFIHDWVLVIGAYELCRAGRKLYGMLHNKKK